MPYVCLLLSGAALLISGLALLDRVPPRDSAVLSLLVGATQLALAAAYVGVTDSSDPRVLLGASGMFLFGLTFVYAGLNALLRLGSKGLGWFSGLVGGIGVLLASAWFPEDPLLGVLWLCWAFLYILFFLRMAFGFESLAAFNGWALVLTSQVTTTIPAFMGLSGHWPYDPGVAVGTAATVGVLVVASGGLSTRRRRAPAGVETRETSLITAAAAPSPNHP